MGPSSGMLNALAGWITILVVAMVCAVFALRERNARIEREALVDPGVSDDALAATMQSALLPAMLPIMDGLQVSASYAPAGDPGNAGGDFYDAFVLDDGTLAVVIGDASGAGVSAALTMNVVRQALRSAMFEGLRPVEALRRANRVLLRSDASAHTTAIAGTIHPATLQFRYACAGHPPPLLANGGDAATTLPGAGKGIPLGVVPYHVATESLVTIPPDGLLALYTDGVLEHDGDIAAGATALGEALVEARNLGLGRPAVAIERAITGGRARHDDAAIMTIAPTATLSDVDLCLPAEPASTSLARSAMRRFLASTPLDATRSYDALVATGEAISNAVEHAYNGRAVQTFALRARCDDNKTIVIAIEDYGAWKPPDHEPARGRGLGIMQELADACDIERGPWGTRVTLNFAVHASVPEATLI